METDQWNDPSAAANRQLSVGSEVGGPSVNADSMTPWMKRTIFFDSYVTGWEVLSLKLKML